MSRFNSPEEVQAAAQKFAANIVRLHHAHGHDLNPYCTQGARSDFDRAYENKSRYSWEIDPAWDYRYQTGRAVALLIENQQEN
jgi:hypothetical protein